MSSFTYLTLIAASLAIALVASRFDPSLIESRSNGNTATACDIKGNISLSRNGERIYHVPGQNDYDATVISISKGERWFCSEDEARAAGWRKVGY